MNTHTSYETKFFDSKFCHVIKSRNNLAIDRIDYIKDSQRDRLVIFLESEYLIDREVNAIIQDNNLIIEAPRSLDFDKPFKTHLMDKETLSETDRGLLDIGFSEVQLNRGYKYSVISCQMINPRLLKVILNFHPVRKNQKNFIN